MSQLRDRAFFFRTGVRVCASVMWSHLKQAVTFPFLFWAAYGKACQQQIYGPQLRRTICRECGRQWEAFMPDGISSGVDALECPACHKVAGDFAPEEKNDA